MRNFSIKRMMRFLLILCVISLLSGSHAVFGAQQGKVYDDAGLLTESEQEKINTQIDKMQEDSGWEIYAVTTVDADGKNTVGYADDFFDTHAPDKNDGVVVLIDMDNREITISTCGEASRYLTDSRLDNILDDAYTDISEEAYGDCLVTMLIGVERAYDAGVPNGQYNYDVETGEVFEYRIITWVEALAAFVLAAGVGIAVYVIVAGRYKLRYGTYQYDFRGNGQVALRVKEDRFVNEVTIPRRIPRQTDTGGGSHNNGRSSVHQSSSGRTHGGQSRKF